MKSFSMVNGNKIVLTAASMAVVILLLLPVLGLGKTLEIDAKKAAQIKSGLNMIKTVANFMLTDNQIKQALNTGLGLVKTGTDITYGLVVLSAMNEFDLIDMVSSQRYKTLARDYFNSILDERINLKGYFTGIGFDLPSVVRGAVSGPMAALTLNSFAITDKTVAVFSALGVLRQEKLYDGIWRYFDSRRGGENHLVAWEDAKAEMGGIGLTGTGKFLNDPSINSGNESKLALHFADLWSKWGKYTDYAGITQEARDSFNSDMGQLIVQATQSRNFAVAKPTFWQNVKSFFSGIFGGIADAFADIREGLKDMISSLKPKEISRTLTAQLPLGEEGTNETQLQEDPDDLSGQLDLLDESSPTPEASPPPTPTLTPSPSATPIPSVSPAPSATPSPSPSQSPFPSPSITPSPSPSASPLVTPSPSPSVSPSATPSLSPSPSPSPAQSGGVDSRPPTTLNLITRPSANFAIISWQTDEDSVANFEYGLNALFGNSFSDLVFSQKHVFYLENLTPKTTYFFRFQNRDSHGNEIWSTMQSFQTPGRVLVNEVQTGTNEFVELYNPNQEPINIAGFYLNYYSASKNWAEPQRRWPLPAGATIPANGYYLVGIYNFPETGGDPNSNWQVRSGNGDFYTSGQLSAADGGLALVPFDVADLTDETARKSALDAVGWGMPLFIKEGSPAVSAGTDQSIERASSNIDTNNNAADFQIETKPTPTNSSGQTKFYDTSAPETIIGSFPVSPTDSTSAVFDFGASEANSTFECQVDAENWVSCVSPKEYHGLSVGSHQFRVRATDGSGNIDPTPADYLWEIIVLDTTPPETSLGVPLPSNPTTAINADFSFSSDDSAAVFECRFDAGSWASCQSPKNYQGLAVANHQFEVRAIDNSNNIDPTPASYAWEIQTGLLVPVLSLTNYKVNSPNFTINWSAGGQYSHFDVQVKIGSNNWQDWIIDTQNTSKDYSAPDDFTLYKFQARTGDGLGNHSAWAEIEAGYASVPVVVNEIMYNPSPGSDSYYEYVELYNSAGFDVDLKDWILITEGGVNGQEQLLAADTTHGGSSTIIKAGGYAIIGDKTTGISHIFDSVYYQIPAYSDNVIRLEINDSELGLKNDSTQVKVILKDKNGNLIDQVAYSWEWGANGNGKSLAKTNPLRFSDSRGNWGEDQINGTPGTQNSNYSASALNYFPINYIVDNSTILSPGFGQYVIDDSLTIASNAVLTIKPGTIIRFKYSSSVTSRGKLIINGQILAQGTQSQPIVFTSSRDTASDFTQTATNNPAYYGDWNYIEINSTSQNSVFNNIIVRYGGVAFDFMPEKGAFRILGANVAVKNSLFDNSRVAGIYLNNAGGSTLENLVLRNHRATYGNSNLSSVAIWIRNGGLPTISNLQITNNAYGVYWPGGTCADLTGNPTITFSQNSKDAECGCCPL